MIYCELVPVVRVKFLVLHVRFLEGLVASIIIRIGGRAASSALLTGPFPLQDRPLKKGINHESNSNGPLSESFSL
jgi:hypothetical protein